LRECGRASAGNQQRRRRQQTRRWRHIIPQTPGERQLPRRPRNRGRSTAPASDIEKSTVPRRRPKSRQTISSQLAASRMMLSIKDHTRGMRSIRKVSRGRSATACSLTGRHEWLGDPRTGLPRGIVTEGREFSPTRLRVEPGQLADAGETKNKL
jgi:hypothetical protein